MTDTNKVGHIYIYDAVMIAQLVLKSRTILTEAATSSKTCAESDVKRVLVIIKIELFRWKRVHLVTLSSDLAVTSSHVARYSAICIDLFHHSLTPSKHPLRISSHDYERDVIFLCFFSKFNNNNNDTISPYRYHFAYLLGFILEYCTSTNHYKCYKLYLGHIFQVYHG